VRSPPLILASASPRRTQLLQAIGVRHEVVPAEGDEPAAGAMPPTEHARASALFKAREVAARHPGRLVLGADTIVVIGDSASDVLGKPRDAADAARMLRMLSGRSHRVLTGIALCGGRAGEAVEVATTTVRFAAVSDELIARYVATGEPLDKAGAYAVQGYLATHVEAIDGSWPNVVGLPVERLPALFDAAREDLVACQDW
jgi:septum formation protein